MKHLGFSYNIPLNNRSIDNRKRWHFFLLLTWDVTTEVDRVPGCASGLSNGREARWSPRWPKGTGSTGSMEPARSYLMGIYSGLTVIYGDLRGIYGDLKLMKSRKSFGYSPDIESQLWKRTFCSQKLITGTIGYEPLMGLKSDILIKYIFCPESW